MRILIGLLISIFAFGIGQAVYRCTTETHAGVIDHLAQGKEIMKHFDKHIPLTKADAKEAIEKARDAYAEFLMAQSQGLDPGTDLEDAQIKWEFWHENLQKIEQAEVEVNTEQLTKPTYR